LEKVFFFIIYYWETNFFNQGASPDGKTPDGGSYIDAAEKDEIKALLK